MFITSNLIHYIIIIIYSIYLITLFSYSITSSISISSLILLTQSTSYYYLSISHIIILDSVICLL